MDEGEEIPAFKVALIGGHYSGKTSIITAFHTGNFLEKTKPTLGANFVSHVITLDGKSVELQIWDTAVCFYSNSRVKRSTSHSVHFITGMQNAALVFTQSMIWTA